MANKLGLTNEVKEIKLGKSFGKGDHPSFHTFRYDFMPASLSTTKRALVDVGEGNQVTVTVPHNEGSGTASTVYKGSKKPYQKECVLIIDHVTGEITLEKLGNNVQLKKTRAEGSSKARSNTPIDNNLGDKKSPPSHKWSPQQRPHSMPMERGSPIRKCSPLPKSPVNSQPSPNGSSNHSMPSLNNFTTRPPPPPPIPEPPGSHLGIEDVADAPEIGLLSSSSSSASESSAESSDSDSSDNGEMTEVPKQKSKGIPNGCAESPKRKEHPSAHSSSSTLSMPSANSLPSMPKFSQLSEDLKLSESDSSDCEF